MESDAQLVRTVLQGETKAFAALVARYERPVKAAVLQIVPDIHLAGDIAQDAFVKAWQNLGNLQKPQRFGPWLMTIAKHCAVDAHRKRDIAAAPVDENTPDKTRCNGQLDEDKQQLLAALSKLPVSEKQVVMLRYFRELTVAEVAQACGRSVGTVTKQLSRAHQRLRKILKESDYDF